MSMRSCFNGSYFFLIKSLQILPLLLHGQSTDLRDIKSGIISDNYLKNCTSQLLQNLKNKNYTHLLKTLFGVLILSKFNKGFSFLLRVIHIYSKYA